MNGCDLESCADCRYHKLAVESADSLQQLKAKISALCNKADRCLNCGMSLDAILPILRSMRKLLAIRQRL